MFKAGSCGLLLVVALVAASCSGAEGGAGKAGAARGTPAAAKSKRPVEAVRYVAENQPALALTLQESSAGAITGTLAEGTVSLPVVARRQETGFAGTVGPPGEELPFTAIERGDMVVLEIGAGEEVQRLTFRRAGAGAGAVAPGKRNVVINDRRLSDAEVARAEQSYQVRIPDANYWYDPMLGAWGAKGGPTMGFIAPGLELGGPLQPDASGRGGTNVFVNGRELHVHDLAALQTITGPIVPGRYFITAQGLAGYEGGPPQWDLAAMAAQSRGGGGGSNTWQSGITGASGFSDGTTGAVFLPNGGIVSTGN